MRRRRDEESAVRARLGGGRGAIASASARAALPCALLVTWHLVLAGVPEPASPAARAASQPADQPISAAEQLLFMHPHLAATHGPRTLAYAYVAEAASSPRVTDRATLALQMRGDGTCCALHGEYLSGPMAVHLPDLDAANANPILLYFLEGEVRLMERTTHGQSAHFRRQIRQSLATTATVHDTTLRWNGNTVAAHVVQVAPFLDDPYRARFEREAKTEYAFVLSDEVPGGVVALSATLPGSGAGSPPLAWRSLTLETAPPAAPAKP
jgi:hypothetical protein